MRTCSWCLLSPPSLLRPFLRQVQTSFWISATLLALFSVPHVCAQNPSNPKQVALQRWYSVNTVAQITACTGSYPYWVEGNVAFDGAHMWVPCFYDNYGTPDVQAAEIQEFNASDGTLLRTIPITIPANTMWFSNLLFDGENIWMAVSVFQAMSHLIKIQASTGTIVNTFTLPDYTGFGLAFDGTNIWVGIESSNSVSKVLATTGTVTTYSTGSCEQPDYPIFAGSNIWISCSMGNTVQELNANGVEVATVLVGYYPKGPAFDGTNVWVANSNVFSVSRINVTTLVMTPFLWGGCNAGQLIYDGHYIWVSGSSTQGDDCGTGSTSNLVSVTSKMDVSTGAILASFPNIGGATGFDGSNVWGNVWGPIGITATPLRKF